jgi:glycosyltransferase involved in cell wall biosynthesis
VRITFVLPEISFTTPVGGYRVHYELADRLAQRGHKITIVHTTASRRVWLRCRIWSLARLFSARPLIQWFSFLPAGPRFVVVRRVSPSAIPSSDVVLFTQWKTISSPSSFGPQTRCFALVWDYESWSQGTETHKAAMRAAFASEGLALVAGSVAVEDMLNEMGLTPVATIPPGLDREVFRPLEAVSREPDTVGFLNRAGAHRGLDVLFAALESLRERTVAFRAVATGAAKAPRPAWVEWQACFGDDELAAFYSSAAVFILPSRSEGLGLPAIEAMACGAAVVVTDNGGSRQFAHDGDNCIVVPVDRPDLLADAVAKLLGDAGLRERLGRRGQEVSAAFDWETTVTRYEELFDDSARS